MSKHARGKTGWRRRSRSHRDISSIALLSPRRFRGRLDSGAGGLRTARDLRGELLCLLQLLLEGRLGIECFEFGAAQSGTSLLQVRLVGVLLGHQGGGLGESIRRGLSEGEAGSLAR